MISNNKSVYLESHLRIDLLGRWRLLIVQELLPRAPCVSSAPSSTGVGYKGWALRWGGSSLILYGVKCANTVASIQIGTSAAWRKLERLRQFVWCCWVGMVIGRFEIHQQLQKSCRGSAIRSMAATWRSSISMVSASANRCLLCEHMGLLTSIGAIFVVEFL